MEERLRRILMITLVAAAVCLIVSGGALFWLGRRAAYANMVEASQVKAALFTDPKAARGQLALADEQIRLLQKSGLVDYRPWTLKGDACAGLGDYKSAEACFREALRAMGDPRLRPSEFVDEKRADRWLELARRMTLKKLEWIKAGRAWKSPEEITHAIKEDMRAQKNKNAARRDEENHE